MKKHIIMGILLGGVAVNGWATCTYNFDATALEIQQMNPGATPPAKKFTIQSQNTGSFLLENKSYQYYANSAVLAQSLKNLNSNSGLVTGDKTLPANGKLAFEFKINDFADIPPGSYTGTSSGVHLTGLNFYGTKNGAVKFMGTLWVLNSDDAKTKTVAFSLTDMAGGQFGQEYNIPFNTPNGYRVGIYLDQDSKQIGINLNGQDKGYINNTPLSSASEIGVQLVGLSGGYPLSLSGAFYPSSSLIFDSAQITQNYAAGTKDICGNAL